MHSIVEFIGINLPVPDEYISEHKCVHFFPQQAILQLAMYQLGDLKFSNDRNYLELVRSHRLSTRSHEIASRPALQALLASQVLSCASGQQAMNWKFL